MLKASALRGTLACQFYRISPRLFPGEFFKISMRPRKRTGLVLFLLLVLLTGSASGTTHRKKRHKAISPSRSAQMRDGPVTHRATATKRKLLGSPWKTPTYADSTDGDAPDGDDLTVRRAAVQALGRYNGTVIVADPKTGRILTIVNQKLAFQSGFEPCSTIKIVAALAGLAEGILQNQNTLFQLSRHRTINLTQALAHSNNQFFAAVGVKLGYDKIAEYAHLFGLGERAGLNLNREQAGSLADHPPTDGLGMMTSFGEGFHVTPLELTALMTAVANGGTLYYLQHPRSQQEINQFMPRVKRQLDIAHWIAEIKPGLMGAVEYGTARRANFNPIEPIFGKTGTCTDDRSPTHLGWFGSYNEAGDSKLVVVILLTGGHAVNGPVASGVAGAVYKNLSEHDYFAKSGPTPSIASTPTQPVAQ
jgi:penicillin-binding protein 2